LVVPTGFEPVFKDDYDFALYFREFRRFHSGQKGVRLKRARVYKASPVFMPWFTIPTNVSPDRGSMTAVRHEQKP